VDQALPDSVLIKHRRCRRSAGRSQMDHFPRCLRRRLVFSLPSPGFGSCLNTQLPSCELVNYGFNFPFIWFVAHGSRSLVQFISRTRIPLDISSLLSFVFKNSSHYGTYPPHDPPFERVVIVAHLLGLNVLRVSRSLPITNFIWDYSK